MTTFDPENITHVYLRRIDQKLDRIIDDVHDLKVRMTAVAQSVVGLQRRMDRFDERVERLENRAGLVDDVVRENKEPFKGPKS